MKLRALALRRLSTQAAAPLSLATAEGPVFAMLDAPGVLDAHGDSMDRGALKLPPGVSEILLYWMHSYHPEVVPASAHWHRHLLGGGRPVVLPAHLQPPHPALL